MLSLVSAMPAAATKPHLAFVLVDDLGYNDFFTSQDLDFAWPKTAALAKDSIQMTNYYTQPLCTPTRGALMTGRYPVRLGLQHQVLEGYQDHGLPLDEVTLADKLRAQGYKTYASGKWRTAAATRTRLAAPALISCPGGGRSGQLRLRVHADVPRV